MAKSRKYAKVGDKVKIVIPKLFVRCGYPLTVDIVMDKYAEEVDKLVDKCIEIISPLPKLLSYSKRPTIDVRTDALLERAVAHAIIKREGFGGKDRQIFEEDCLHIEPGTEGIVERRFTVMTGTYTRGYGRYSYDGDYDYQPSYLEKSKAHIVYDITIPGHLPLTTLATNCERIIQNGKTKESKL